MKYFVICPNGYNEVPDVAFYQYLHSLAQDYDLEVLALEDDKVSYLLNAGEDSSVIAAYVQMEVK